MLWTFVCLTKQTPGVAARDKRNRWTVWKKCFLMQLFFFPTSLDWLPSTVCKLDVKLHDPQRSFDWKNRKAWECWLWFYLSLLWFLVKLKWTMSAWVLWCVRETVVSGCWWMVRSAGFLSSQLWGQDASKRRQARGRNGKNTEPWEKYQDEWLVSLAAAESASHFGPIAPSCCCSSLHIYFTNASRNLPPKTGLWNQKVTLG